MDFPNDTTQASAYWYVLSSDFIWVEYRRGIALNIAFPHLICVPEVSQFELKGSKCEDSLANSPNVTWGILRSICTLRSKAACIQPFHLFLSDLSWNGALNRKKKYISMILTLTAPPLWCVSHWPHTAISLGTSSLSVLFFFFFLIALVITTRCDFPWKLEIAIPAITDTFVRWIRVLHCLDSGQKNNKLSQWNQYSNK